MFDIMQISLAAQQATVDANKADTWYSVNKSGQLEELGG